MTFNMDAMCATCGETYGRHQGLSCPIGGGLFVELVAAVEREWICYTATGHGTYGYRRVVANSVESAKATYERIGMHTFVTAEPCADAPTTMPTGIKIMERIKELQTRAAINGIMDDAPPARPLANRRKPPRTVIVQDWLKTVDETELAKEAWEATVAACGGRQS